MPTPLPVGLTGDNCDDENAAAHLLCLLADVALRNLEDEQTSALGGSGSWSLTSADADADASYDAGGASPPPRLRPTTEFPDDAEGDNGARMPIDGDDGDWTTIASSGVEFADHPTADQAPAAAADGGGSPELALDAGAASSFSAALGSARARAAARAALDHVTNDSASAPGGWDRGMMGGCGSNEPVNEIGL